LGLKHSHLASYPHIESCIIALVAYTSYFFSNGLSMSGESSLLSVRVLPLIRSLSHCFSRPVVFEADSGLELDTDDQESCPSSFAESL
jgi:hypothetical protein